MPKKKNIDQEQFISAAVDNLNGKSIRKIMKEYELPEREARWLSRHKGLCIEEFREMVVSRLQVLQEELLEKIREKLDKIPAGQLAVTYGILSDKMAKVQPVPANLHFTQNVGLQLDGKDLSHAELVSIISGAKNERKDVIDVEVEGESSE